MMYVDASALVAILTDEPDADLYTDALDGTELAITSALSTYETAMALARKRRGRLDDSEKDVTDFLRCSGITVVPVAAAEAKVALEAAQRYGKGRGHPAQLNFGDCFAYAVATTHEASLLFKGDDFGKTDIRSAL